MLLNYRKYKSYCIITVSKKNINISNKHNSIIFYSNNKPVRLMVINKGTEIEKCIEIALRQDFNNRNLKEIYEENNIKSSIVDMHEDPIYNDADVEKEIDVDSCDII